MTATPVIYNLFPLLAGPFPQWTPHLERARDMGFNWIYFNPVSYPGFSGSLYSIKDYYGFHPMLAPDGDAQAAQAFADVLARMGKMGLSPMMDLVVNHTAIDSPLIDSHPGWFARDNDGKPLRPGAMDGGEWVTWGDLATVDNTGSADRAALWDYWDRLIAHHQALGVKGFRCDAAYHVPAALWRHLIGHARTRDPEVRFFAETLGCQVEDVEILAQAGFSYVFNSSKWWDYVEPWCLEQYEKTRVLVPSIAFAESHDTPRLARETGGDVGQILARQAFATAFSTGVMMTMGFEFAATRPLNVVRTRPDDWLQRPGTATDLTAAITEINALKTTHPALRLEGPMVWVDIGPAPVTTLDKFTPDGTRKVRIRISQKPGEPVPNDPGDDFAEATEITPDCLLTHHAPFRLFADGAPQP
ncbi:MAG: alpha-amylase family glycosyl hydrolase [Leptospirillia bacterium]